jgi:hypothetical protein
MIRKLQNILTPEGSKKSTDSKADPIFRREFHVFLSSRHVNTSIVDSIHYWLKEVCGINVWYDAGDLHSTSMEESQVLNGIIQSRSAILVLSKTSVTKEWLKNEYEVAKDQKNRFEEFRLVLIRIEECDPPDYMGTTKCIDLDNGKLDIKTANLLLVSLFHNDVEAAAGFEKTDIFVSRTWHKEEAALADYMCELLIEAGFRLIGDSTDQKYFYATDGQERIRSLISNCKGLVSVLPDRGLGTTSPPMLTEIQMARELQIPYFIVRESTVQLEEELDKSAIKVEVQSMKNAKIILQRRIEKFRQECQVNDQRYHAFYTTNFTPENYRRNRYIREHIERVTSMPCETGGKRGDQKIIVKKISCAFMMIADISEENPDTLVYIGVGREAGIKLHLLDRKSYGNLPFMLSDLHLETYSDDIDLMGTVHKIAYDYRRRVWNNEFNL